MDDYSYLGSGKLSIREYGAAAPFVEVGNCSALNFTPQTESKELLNFTEPGGGLQNEVQRVTGVEMSYTFHDFSAENFARAVRGTVTEAIAGTAAAEPVVAYLGGLTPLAYIPETVTEVTDETGVTTYVEGTDYEVRNGALYIPTTSSIAAPVAGAANLAVTYDYEAQDKVEALVNTAKQYEAMFTGLNEARSGKPVRIRAHKISGGVLAQFAAIGEEYGAGEVTNKLLMDGTKTGTGVSKYFTKEIVR